uniref:Uncharacterized protein n=1 Tax=Vespula pensylvanica TaxID=30213 RepID=A0A834PAS9_VESPE|nr:hypothetical protein H0235_002754 [Vespula pensylvanica]
MNELVTSFNALRVTIEGPRKEKNPEEKSKTTGPSSGRTSHVDPLENPNRREIKSTVSLSPDGSHFSDGTVTMKPRGPTRGAKKYRANLGPPPPPLLPPPPATVLDGVSAIQFIDGLTALLGPCYGGAPAGMSAASQLYSHATCSTVGEHRINAETAGSFGPAYYLSRPLAAIDWLPISNACNEPFQEPAVGFFCEIPEIFKETYTKTYLD